jgi:hypothetical protein
MLHICVNYKIGEHTEIQNGRIAADSPDFMKTKSSMEKSSSQKPLYSESAPIFRLTLTVHAHFTSGEKTTTLKY